MDRAEIVKKITKVIRLSPCGGSESNGYCNLNEPCPPGALGIEACQNCVAGQILTEIEQYATVILRR